MQLGMIGLGRMGANLVRRLTRAGHSCVVYDVDVAAVARLQDEGATGAGVVGRVRRCAGCAACGLDHGAGGLRRRHPREAGGAPRSRRRRDRRRQLLLPRRLARSARLSPQRDPLRRRRDERRRLRAGARLLPHDRRRSRAGGATGPGLRGHRARCRRRAAHARAGPALRARPSRDTCTAGPSARVTSSRWCTTGSSTASWLRTRKGSTSCGARTRATRLGPTTRRPRRSATPSSTATTSTSRRWRRCGGGGAWCRRGCSTSLPTRWPRAPSSRGSRAAFPTRVRGVGRSTPPSTRECPRPS